jgi:hypothetical protein
MRRSARPWNAAFMRQRRFLSYSRHRAGERGLVDRALKKAVACEIMTAAAKRIEQEIRQLPLEDMLVLHEQLVASIHERESNEQLDPEFKEEIKKRIKQIDSGSACGIDAFKALE